MKRFVALLLAVLFLCMTAVAQDEGTPTKSFVPKGLELDEGSAPADPKDGKVKEASSQKRKVDTQDSYWENNWNMELDPDQPELPADQP